MTMIDDEECTTCKEHIIHMCNSAEAITKEYGKADCKYCGAKQVLPTHLCRKKINALTHVCYNCGRVSDDPDKLCHPVPIDNSVKASWKHIPPHDSDVLKCKNCKQPITKPGHICDPMLPYVCKYCKQNVTDTLHMCKEIIGKAKYTCKVCGRLAVEKKDVCAPVDLK
jgi:hypothetical protein